MKRRVGILGGTFDPIHCGHLDLGDAASSALDFGTLQVMPLNRPPHRPQPAASGFHRFAMVALATADRSTWQASDLELTHDEPSYTATTLRRFHALGYTSDELFFVIGADAFLEIRTWKDYPNVLDGTGFAVVSRPGLSSFELPARIPELAARMRRSDQDGRSGATIVLIDARTADVSSTAIRDRAVAGQMLTGLVPPPVEQHIERHGLYRSHGVNRPEPPHAADVQAGRLHGES